MPQIDLQAYLGREQAFVKHYLLEKYLPPFAYKVGSAWDSIVYIDGFAGPWEVKDPNLADSSFGVATQTLRRAQTGLREKGKNILLQTILVEENESAFARLQAFAKTKTEIAFEVYALCGEFVTQIPAINLITQKCRNPFRFIFLDPKGWADIPMLKLKPFLRERSCEVLINLMTRHIIRFLDEDDRAESYRNLFGRQGVLEKLRKVPKENDERAEQAVREYCRSLRQLCEFKYVSSAVILKPDKESIGYFLVYATNDFNGIEVFKQAETAAAGMQNEVRHETRVRKSGQEEMRFEDGPPKTRLIMKLRERYHGMAQKRVKRTLAKSEDRLGIPYKELFCEAMAFPLVTPKDLEDWIGSWAPHAKLDLAGPGRRLKPSPGKDDRVLVTNPSAFRET